MKRVLQINISNNVYGGVQAFLVNVYRRIDTDKVQFDFLSPSRGAAYEGVRAEIEKRGGRLYDLDNAWTSLRNKLRFGSKLKKFLTEHPYEIIHIHTGVLSFATICAFVAKRCKVDKIIVHSHSYDPDRNVLKRAIDIFLKRVLRKNATDFLACSDYAAKSLYGKRDINDGRIKIIHNGVDIEHFKFDKKARRDERKALGIENNDVYGHVGRFEDQKNHEFLIDIFEQISRVNENARLVLVGEGSLMGRIKEKVRDLGIEDKVIFLGAKQDVAKYYSVFDVFILPSLSEGFGLVIVEALSSGLPVLSADTIPEELKQLDGVHTKSLSSSAKEWALSCAEIGKNTEMLRMRPPEEIKNRYDIEMTTGELEDLYVSSEEVPLA